MAEDITYMMEKAEELGNSIAAIKYYEDIIKNQPDNLQAWLKKGLIHANLKHPNSATKCFNKVLEIDPNNSIALDHKNKLKELTA